MPVMSSGTFGGLSSMLREAFLIMIGVELASLDLLFGELPIFLSTSYLLWLESLFTLIFLSTCKTAL